MFKFKCYFIKPWNHCAWRKKIVSSFWRSVWISRPSILRSTYASPKIWWNCMVPIISLKSPGWAKKVFCNQLGDASTPSRQFLSRKTQSTKMSDIVQKVHCRKLCKTKVAIICKQKINKVLGIYDWNIYLHQYNPWFIIVDSVKEWWKRRPCIPRVGGLSPSTGDFSLQQWFADCCPSISLKKCFGL